MRIAKIKVNSIIQLRFIKIIQLIFFYLNILNVLYTSLAQITKNVFYI